MQDDERFARSDGETAIEGAVPLAILFAETGHHEVAIAEMGAGADTVEQGPLAIGPEGVGFIAENPDTAVITGVVIGDGRGEGDGQLRFAASALDGFAPVGVDFASEIDGPGFAHAAIIKTIGQSSTRFAGGG